MNLSQAKYNWKHVDKAKFTTTICSALDADEDLYDDAFDPLHSHAIRKVTLIKLDKATNLLQRCMQEAAKVSVPIQKPLQRSKPWWTPELTASIKKINAEVAEIGQLLKGRTFIDPKRKTYVKHLCATFKRLYTKTKREYYTKLTQNATPQTLYSFAKWTWGSRQLMSPAILCEGHKPAMEHKDKCDALREALSPKPPELPDAHYPGLEEDHIDNIEWEKVTQMEVKEAIFAAGPHNAPGISKMTRLAYHMAWEVAEEELFLITLLSAEIGHHRPHSTC